MQLYESGLSGGQIFGNQSRQVRKVPLCSDKEGNGEKNEQTRDQRHGKKYEAVLDPKNLQIVPFSFKVLCNDMNGGVGHMRVQFLYWYGTYVGDRV